MFGTLVNAASIIVCSLVGLLIGSRFSKKMQDITTQAIGLATIFVGASTALKRMINEPCSSILFVISLVIGGLAGVLLDIDGRMKKIGDFIESRFSGGEGSVSKSFVTASILYCTGTMAILGSVESGLYHNYTILFTKSVLDGVYALICASTMGFGVMFSAVTVLLYQGAITILAGFLSPYLTGDIMREISVIGGILITALGIDMMGIKRIKVANLLPAVLVPVIYYAAVYILT